MVFASIYPSEYDQPKPIDGEYAATVFETHAEFQYLGRKVIASAHSSINANGSSGKVVVKGFGANISLDYSAPDKGLDYCHYYERETSLESALIATLVPRDFDQPHPFLDNPQGFKTRTKSIDVSFGYTEKYSATLDDYIQFAVRDAPCTVKPIDGKPMKCLVVLDDATIF